MSEIVTEADKAVIRPGCDIVSSMAATLQDELKGLLDEGAARLVVDLQEVEMVDSMGLGVLIAAHNSLLKKDAKLELINIPPDILKLIKNMRLDKHFIIA